MPSETTRGLLHPFLLPFFVLLLQYYCSSLFRLLCFQQNEQEKGGCLEETDIDGAGNNNEYLDEATLVCAFCN